MTLNFSKEKGVLQGERERRPFLDSNLEQEPNGRCPHPLVECVPLHRLQISIDYRQPRLWLGTLGKSRHPTRVISQLP